MIYAQTAFVLLSMGFFALWRRSFGGWLGGGKVLRHFVLTIVYLAMCVVTGNTIYVFAALAVASIPHWQMGHELDGPLWKTLGRYSVAPSALAVVAGIAGHWEAMLPLLAVGPLSAAGCWAVLRPGFVRWANQFLGAPLRLWDTRTDFIDGHLAFAELGLGAVWGFGTGLALVLF